VITVQATDAIGLIDTVDLDLTVGPPVVGLQVMAQPFLGVGTPIPPLETFLDLQGDNDGTYDLGDFRAWVLGNPNHPLNTPAVPSAPGLTDPVVIRLFAGDQR